MSLGSWVHSVVNPSHAYMQRNAGLVGKNRPRGQRPWRRAVQEGGYWPIGSDPSANRLDPEVAERLRARARTEQEHEERERNHRAHDIENRYGDVVRGAAMRLATDGQATITTAGGPVEARIVMFRKDAVLKIEARGRGMNQSQDSHARVRDPAVLERALTHFLAELRPPAEPFTNA
jgi:hypothetical protein